jgi:hypothetical protein
MSDWNFDISQAPKGEWVEAVEKGGRSGERHTRRYHAPRLILASKCGKVITSRWLPVDEREKRPIGRWEMFSVGEEPVAWQLYPSHPHGESDAA